VEADPLAIRLLGPFEVWRNGHPIGKGQFGRRKARQLLAILVTEPGRVFSYDRLVELLHLGGDVARARRNVHSLVSHLRRTLEPHRIGAPSAFIVRHGDGYCFSEEAPHWLDTETLENLVDQAKSLVGAGRWSDARSFCQNATELYRGDYAPEEPYEEWALAPREHYRGLYAQALEWLAECYAHTGSLHDAICTCEELLALQPWNETAYRQEMYYHYCRGELGVAEETYRLCVERLAEHLEVVPSQETSQLHDRIRSGDAPRIERYVPSNLPHLLTSFVGRQEETARLRAELSQGRLVTLTGFGGVGKTRLALHVAQEVLRSFPHGVWLADLGSISAEEDVPRAVAEALKVEAKPGQPPVAKLIDHLRAKTMLLVLDTCEHVIDASASLVETLLHACPDLRILTTSRETLDIAGEIEWPVPTLTAPREGATQAEVRGSDAAQLFLERAGTQTRPLALTEENTPLVAELCRRLDGLPVALELAANTAKTMPLSEMVSRLDHRLSLLARGKRTAPGRHKTLSAVIDWSYELLSPQQQAVFQRLSAFHGGFTAEAAGTVCVDEEIDREQVETHLAALLAKSLIVFDATARRYRLLDTLHEYAAERLKEGDEDVCRTRHLDFFLDLILRADTRGPAQREWLERFEAELENLRVALTWAEASGAFEKGLRLAGSRAMLVFWERGHHTEEGLHWLRELLRHRGQRQSSAIADALSRAAWLHNVQGQWGKALPLAEEAVAMSRELHDEDSLSTAQTSLGVIRMNANDLDGARAILEENLALNRRIGRRSGVAACLGNLAIIHHRQGDLAGALGQLTAALEMAREAERQHMIAGLLNGMAEIHQQRGEFTEAAARREEALSIARAIAATSLEVWLHIEAGTPGLGCGTDLQGDPATCREHLRRAMKLAEDAGDVDDRFLVHLNRAMLLSSLGDHESAVADLRACLLLTREAECRFGGGYLVPLVAELLLEHNSPRDAMHLLGAAGAGDPSFRTHYQDHVYMNPFRVEQRIRSVLGDARTDKALAEGRSMDLNTLLHQWLVDRSSEDGLTLPEG